MAGRLSKMPLPDASPDLQVQNQGKKDKKARKLVVIGFHLESHTF